MKKWRASLQKEGTVKYVIPKSFRPDMRAPGVFFANERLLKLLEEEDAVDQIVNVATLPGICKCALAMPDIHYGYGFPIGGVAATRLKDGVISPGGVGYDINCGVRLLRSSLSWQEIREMQDRLADNLFNEVPCGLGRGGDIRLDRKGILNVCREGAHWAVGEGYGWQGDLEACESSGRLKVDSLDGISDRAIERGRDQLGSLGSGNHFIEVQRVDAIFDEQAARAFGLEVGGAAVMIHSGSRGFGAQVCSDYISRMKSAMGRYGIELPDRQLACAPINSEEGKSYWASMCAAANYAWANRQCLAWRARKAFEKTFGRSAEALGMHQVYDVAHNIAKIEEHDVGGKKPERVCVHRKGATRAFPPGHAEIAEKYRQVGQPVLVPGDMGRSSWVLVGREEAMKETFGSICHGAGRKMSRSEALRTLDSKKIFKQLEAKGIALRVANKRVAMEEAPQVYKDVDDVIDTCEQARLARKVARLTPMVVVKG